MKLVIYGRPGCSYCTRAKQLAEHLSQQRTDFSYSYIDIYELNLTKDDLSQLVGKQITTVPQIFLDEQHIGGCTDFEAYAKQHLN